MLNQMVAIEIMIHANLELVILILGPSLSHLYGPEWKIRWSLKNVFRARRVFFVNIVGFNKNAYKLAVNKV